MIKDILVFLIFFLTPSLLMLVFARRMVEYNARSYPRVYGPLTRTITLVMCYVIGVIWIVGGVMYLLGR
jgi:hypothetical protein